MTTRVPTADRGGQPVRRDLPLGRKVVYSLIPLVALALGSTALLTVAQRAGWIGVDLSDELVMSGQTEDRIHIGEQGGEITFENFAANTMLTFPARKERGDLRVVVAGGSMAMGIPYTLYPGGDIPRWMQAMLEVRYPSTQPVVINACLGGMNSLGVVEVVKRTAVLEPDIVVVLSGNNEGYVPNPLSRTLHSWLVYRALRKALLFEPDPADRPLFYEQDNRISRINAEFGINLERVVQLSRLRRVDLVMATLPINMKWIGAIIPGREDAYAERGYPPMVPDEAITRGLQLCAEGDFEAAASTFFASEQYYMASYALGQCLEDRGEYEAALETYSTLSESYSMGRTRPSLNEIVRRVAASDPAITFTDLEKTFLSLNPHGLPEHDKFLDNCHMTADGYYLVARELVDAIEAAGLIRPGPGEPLDEPNMEDLARGQEWTHLFEESTPGSFARSHAPVRLRAPAPPAPQEPAP